MLALQVILLILAVYRVTRLLTSDAFPPLASLREQIGDRFGGDSWQAYLAECPWCVSMYVATLTVLMTVLTTGCPYPVFMVLAASAATGIIDTFVDPA